MEQVVTIEQRQRNLRIIFFIIILATLPFYCVGIFLWISAPQRPNTNQIATQTALARTTTPRVTAPSVSNTPNPNLPSVTPIGQGTIPPLFPTPSQFVPPPVITRFLSPTIQIIFPTSTDFVFPTSTPAPTLTSFPTLSPAPPTLPPPPTDQPTPLPFPSETTVPAPDSDGDGIGDNFDECPFEVGVPPNGCPAAIAPTVDPIIGNTPIPP